MLAPWAAPAATEESRPPAVRLLRAIPEFEDAIRVLCEAFHTDDASDLINTSVMRALEMSDNYVTGVYLDGEMVGAAMGVRGREAQLHSHIAGIHPKHQGEGLGYELKMHERRWARERGLTNIQWTFDPLVRRNAHFNLCKLDTRVLKYYVKLYGELADGLNSGDETDRLLVQWDITTETREPRPAEHAADLVGPVTLDPLNWDFGAAPDATVASANGSVRLVQTPHDIENLRLEQPELAARWRRAVRLGLSALDRGFTVTGFTVDGCYVLRRP